MSNLTLMRRKAATAPRPARMPHQRPCAPSGVANPRNALTGVPISQNPNSATTIGARVSPIPRRIPTHTTWSPSNT